MILLTILAMYMVTTNKEYASDILSVKKTIQNRKGKLTSLIVVYLSLPDKNESLSAIYL
jgi:hypothetical protein